MLPPWAKLTQLVGWVILWAACTQPQARVPATVTFTTHRGAVRVDAEVASTPAAHERGLMYRRSLGANAGMLFVFTEDAGRTFWMKNTYIPLDLLFVDFSGKVVGIVENAEPMTLTPRSAPAPARFVVEVNGGFARRHGLAVGDRATFTGLP